MNTKTENKKALEPAGTKSRTITYEGPKRRGGSCPEITVQDKPGGTVFGIIESSLTLTEARWVAEALTIIVANYQSPSTPEEPELLSPMPKVQSPKSAAREEARG